MSRLTRSEPRIFGVSVATVFTLYLVPGLYGLFARRTQSPGTIARKMRQLAEEAGP